MKGDTRSLDYSSYDGSKNFDIGQTASPHPLRSKAPIRGHPMSGLVKNRPLPTLNAKPSTLLTLNTCA